MTKKRLVLAIAATFILVFALIIWAAYFSFATVKPTAEEINKKLTSLVFSKIIYIPQGIPRPSLEFYQTRYFWEMETNQKEVIGVTFIYTPSFEKKDDKIIATLEMPQNGDPSIFTKVLPAVIADEQSLNSALDPQKENLGENQNAYYSKLELQKDPKNNQTIKLIWTYEKSKFPQEVKSLYHKLNYPASLLKFFYTIPNFLLDLARG